MSYGLADFDYDLPKALIAQEPASPRDSARMMIIDRQEGKIEHSHFYRLPKLLTEDDLIVINQTKVFPARLVGTKETGGKVEVLLLEETEGGSWEALSQPGLPVGTKIKFTDILTAQVVKPNNEEGVLGLTFSVVGERLVRMIEAHGLTPLPPYIHSPLPEKKLKQEYQTVYANEWGSAAAPTAGMHFTQTSLKKLVDEGVGVVPITLHVGLGTFLPVNQKQIDSGALHSEKYCIPKQAANKILEAKKQGKRIIAVGTTTARALESAVGGEGDDLTLESEWRKTDLFIKPPYRFRLVDSLITNFHLPQSSLLMMVAAFMTTPNVQKSFISFEKSDLGLVYRTAIEEQYRFYSFGDGMWIR